MAKPRAVLLWVGVLALGASACTSSPHSGTSSPHSGGHSSRSAAASGSVASSPSTTASPAVARVRAPAAATAVVPGTAADALAAGTSQALFAASRDVVVVAAGDPAAQAQAAASARARRVPLLLAGPAAASEVHRLGARRLLAVGTGAQAWAHQQASAQTPGQGGGLRVTDVAVTAIPSSSPTASSSPPTSSPSSPVTGPAPAAGPASGTLVLTTGAPEQAAAVATAEAAGARVATVPSGDPRADGALVSALHAAPPGHVLALGDAFGPVAQVAARMAVADTGVQVPGGGQLPLAGRRVVALYGVPGTPSLGVLGQQPMAATIARAKQVAASYAGLGGLPAVPALEIIATVASGTPGANGDYSSVTPEAQLRPWVDAATAAGEDVVLDLQPGRADFLSQARQYADLLALPDVGLALDPEWRLGPGQRPLAQVGSVDVGEINATSAWLAQLTADHHLPRKIFLIHQFRLSMIRDRAQLDTDHDELTTVLHSDGHGDPGTKAGTWHAVTAGAPAGVVWGWKDFYREDTPMLTPAQTVAEQPSPLYVSYQ